ncbi:MAG: asparaginase [Candidatus Kerfeldbacteria bacterium]|nr:asparaginase [Candidatus Kerfeldbacteria bacterium]
MFNKETIQFILTGGTIDSYYSAVKDTAVPNKQSVLPQFIQGLKLYEKVVFTEVCMKDSRDLARTDLDKILKAVVRSKSRKIIITHGTYTMSDTARYLKAKLKKLDKTIIFTR